MNLPSTVPVVEHYLVGEPDRHGVINTICSSRVNAFDFPIGAESTRCAECEKALDQVKTVVDYARRWAISPCAAGAALNMPLGVRIELQTVLG